MLVGVGVVGVADGVAGLGLGVGGAVGGVRLHCWGLCWFRCLC